MIELRSRPVQEGSSLMTEDEICDEVLGTRPGYIRGLGHGMVPASSLKRSVYCSHPEVSELLRRAEDAERHAQEQNRKIEELQKENDQKIQSMDEKWTSRFQALAAQLNLHNFCTSS